MNAYNFTDAVRDDTSLLIGIAGASGSGKTMSALRMATGLAQGDPIYFIDTEAKRGLHYAQEFKFKHLDMRPPFTPEAFAGAISTAEKAGAKVIIIDSMSDEYEGMGGLQEMHDDEVARLARKAAESPIIWLATQIRTGTTKFDEMQTDGLIVTGRKHLDPHAVIHANMVIVGRNDTRQRYNDRLRELAGHKKSTPDKGEPLICLRNDKLVKIFNGDILRVQESRLHKTKVNLLLDDPDSDRRAFKVQVRKEFFQDEAAALKLPYSELRGTQHFTYGYAITCHKSQGSQWDNVCVFDESSVFRDDRARWLYTAVTRAAEHLTLVI